MEGQNKSLNREVKKFKRKLLEKSKDLENLHNKYLELEQLVAIIQQCWGQVRYYLNFIFYISFIYTNISKVNYLLIYLFICLQVNQTATQLIGSLQEPNGETTTNIEINQLLSSYLQAGSKYLTHNPVGTDYKDSALNLDQWSNPNEIEKEQSRLQELINSRTDDVVYGTDLNEIASRHVETTGQLLGQLCNGVVHCGKLNVQQAELLFRPNINIREVQSEREILVTRVVKLNQAIIDLKFQLHTANVDRERLHRKVLLAGEIQGVVLAPLVRSASDGSSVVGGITTPAAAVIPPSSSVEAVVVEDEEKMQVDGNSSSLALRVNESVPTQDGSIDSSMAASLIGKTCSVPTTHAGHNEQEEVLRQQLELLEKQLTDCEAERLRLDTAITDHIATVPVTVSSETAELQKALDLLRTHTQQRVDTAHKEVRIFLF